MSYLGEFFSLDFHGQSQDVFTTYSHELLGLKESHIKHSPSSDQCDLCDLTYLRDLCLVLHHKQCHVQQNGPELGNGILKLPRGSGLVSTLTTHQGMDELSHE